MDSILKMSFELFKTLLPGIDKNPAVCDASKAQFLTNSLAQNLLLGKTNHFAFGNVPAHIAATIHH